MDQKYQESEQNVFASMILQMYAIDELRDLEENERINLSGRLHGKKIGIIVKQVVGDAEDVLFNEIKTLYENELDKMSSMSKYGFEDCALMLVSEGQIGEKQKKRFLKQFIRENEDENFIKIYIASKTRLFEYDSDTQTINTVKMHNVQQIKDLTKQYMQN